MTGHGGNGARPEFSGRRPGGGRAAAGRWPGGGRKFPGNGRKSPGKSGKIRLNPEKSGNFRKNPGKSGKIRKNLEITVPRLTVPCVRPMEKYSFRPMGNNKTGKKNKAASARASPKLAQTLPACSRKRPILHEEQALVTDTFSKTVRHGTCVARLAPTMFLQRESLILHSKHEHLYCTLIWARHGHQDANDGTRTPL